MKVMGPAEEKEIRARVAEDARSAFQKAAEDTRVCSPQCAAVCPTCGDTSCRCACSSNCPEMPAQLSSDDRSPVEAGIAPLAFELKKLGCFMPCWSCEGHLNPQGEPWKIPQVWFYADSMTCIRALSDVVADLHVNKVTSASWEVALTHSAADTLAPTFALRPKGTVETAGPLEALRDDVNAIARVLQAKYLARINSLKLSAEMG